MYIKEDKKIGPKFIVGKKTTTMRNFFSFTLPQTRNYIVNVQESFFQQLEAKCCRNYLHLSNMPKYEAKCLQNKFHCTAVKILLFFSVWNYIFHRKRGKNLERNFPSSQVPSTERTLFLFHVLILKRPNENWNLSILQIKMKIERQKKKNVFFLHSGSMFRKNVLIENENWWVSCGIWMIIIFNITPLIYNLILSGGNENIKLLALRACFRFLMANNSFTNVVKFNKYN